MAVSMSPEVSLEGHPVTGEAKVAASGSLPATGGEGAADPGLNLFVANLSSDVNDELFATTFGKFGTILSAKVMLDIHTGISRGFGFVLYKSEAEGLNALADLQGKPLGKKDNPMVITRAQTTGRNAVNETPKLHMRNVPKAVTEAELHQVLAKYGKTERVIMKEDTDAPPQVTSVGGTSPQQQQNRAATWRVFVQYTTAAEANACVSALHNSKPFPDMLVPLMAKPAETPEMRAARKQRQDARRPAGATGSGSPQVLGGMMPGRTPGSPNGAAAGMPMTVSTSGQPVILQHAGGAPVGGNFLPAGAAPPGMVPVQMMPQPGQAPPPGQMVMMQPPPPHPAGQGHPGQPPPSYQPIAGVPPQAHQPRVLQTVGQPAGFGMASMSDSMEFSLTNSMGGSGYWGQLQPPPHNQPHNLVLVGGQPMHVQQPGVAQHAQQQQQQQQQFMVPQQQSLFVQPPPPPIQQNPDSLVPVFAGQPPPGVVHAPPGAVTVAPPASPPNATAQAPRSPLVASLSPGAGNNNVTANLEASIEELSRSQPLNLGVAPSTMTPQSGQLSMPQPAGSPSSSQNILPIGPPGVGSQNFLPPGQQPQYVVLMPKQQ